MNKKILFLLLALNTLSCALFQESDKTEDILPRDVEIPGWVTDGSPEYYTPGNIKEFIKDPERIRLLYTYGFKELFTAKYKKISGTDIALKVEIYAMESPLKAFGVLSMEKNSDTQPEKEKKVKTENTEENEGDDSYSTEQGLFSRKGQYYIIAKPVRGYIDGIQDCRMFTEIICGKIKNSDPLPSYLSLFGGTDNRKSLVYRIEGHPILRILKEIFTRKFEISGKTKTVFFAKRETRHLSLREFSGLLKNDQSRFILSGAGESQTAFLKVKDNDYIFASVFKEWIFGIMDAESLAEGEKTISYLYKDLSEFIKNSRK
ncbi:MAG: DUF6599 family protein [Spirochaetota bacterium]